MNQELRSFLKETRTKLGYSLRQAEKQCGVSHIEIYRIEEGIRQEISLKNLQSIATGYGLPYIDLLRMGGYLPDQQLQAKE